ncbi:MAG: phage integrase SAM-like domain-containing protein [Bacteroidales bacterium]|nr:phage integrase SAM-like domain-containing protein [Bacteroidales bacterium]
MATFKPCVRGISKDNHYFVYILVTHKSKPAYIKTTFRVDKSKVRNKQIKDNSIITRCSILIEEYNKRLNLVDTSKWDIKDIVEYLKNESCSDISFSMFARLVITRMINENRRKSSENYKMAINTLEKFTRKNDIQFGDITSKLINTWIDSLKNTSRAKSLYPTCIKRIFNLGLLEFNDYDKNIIKINHRPFERVKIPKESPSKKRAITKQQINTLLTLEATTRVEEMAKDVCTMILCLAGINTADLYDLDKESIDTKTWKLKYSRKKTRQKRGDGAYTEITVPEIIRPIFEKYKGNSKLFKFNEVYSTPDNFNKYINKGIKALIKNKDLPTITTYTLRHSWATIAQNDCGASTELVAFALNHASAYKVTEGYIKKDYSPIDKINEKVIIYLFG